MRINFDKREGSWKNNEWTFYIHGTAKKSTHIAQEHANTKKKVEAIYEDEKKKKQTHRKHKNSDYKKFRIVKNQDIEVPIEAYKDELKNIERLRKEG